ncbi:hypothetical protein KK141_18170 [Dyella sp. LX-66]|uniref:AbiU2 domain-containing protein n=1 Tax=unclassified Dyella TaxID=2634549 RepID=UPI001BE0C51A|nr:MULTISPECIES: hypothetical protein [unclassified Dyella]MBT2119107.1 hypothetical protein [Dyella sp. LX-1]MBT2141478.1 hypothetical protein [Dyella sp. LX-66]
MASKNRSVTEEQFSTLFMALARDVVDAHIFWDQAKALRAQMEQWPEVNAEGPAFWLYTLEAHQRTALSCLCRVFDQEPNTLHLRSLLMLTRDHRHYFGKGASAQRQADDPFAQWLPDDAVAPEPAQVTADIALCARTDPDVAALALFRDNFIAHRSTKLSMSEKPPTMPLQHERIEHLLDRARTLLNRYSYMRDASFFSMTPLGHEAVEAIFKCVQGQLNHLRKRCEAEAAAAEARSWEFELALQQISATAEGREEEARAERKALAERFGLTINDAGDRFGIVIFRGPKASVSDG